MAKDDDKEDKKPAAGGGDDEKRAAAKAAGLAKKAEKEAKAKAAAAKAAAPKEVYKRTAPPRMQQKYNKEVIPALQKEFGYKNSMQVPRLLKISINMGLGEAITNPKVVDVGAEELGLITGQQPVVTKAKKSIATFKLREGMKIGAMVTLRRERMWEFLDRLVSFALPRVRDFKGVSPRAFDGRGNYSLGVKEQIIFPEINYDRIEKVKGMNVCFVTTAKTDDEGRALLRALGMPFRA
ncbi:MAG: 50S ribosomal protein L5 [Deltaproteobacteria bacterium]|nr:50S ribosomal protein L5 [Deltaproteobacteria bacterium]